MLPWTVIGKTLSPDGTTLVLARRGDEWEISADGYTLMSSRMHGSEEALARLALASAPRARSVLIGGLGLGYSLRAALDRLPRSARVAVAELSPAVVEWNRTHVARLAACPLDDARVRVDVGDVREAIRKAKGEWDVILLDVDNGPGAIAQASNAGLYDAAGVRSCRRALRAGGVLAVWSAGPDERYLRRLKEGGFQARVEYVRPRSGGGRKHAVFVGVATSARTPKPSGS
jgi:spermidine synthase